MIEKKSETQFVRRTFLKGIAATGAMGAIATAHTTNATLITDDNKTAKSWRDKPDPIEDLNSRNRKGGRCHGIQIKP